MDSKGTIDPIIPKGSVVDDSILYIRILHLQAYLCWEANE